MNGTPFLINFQLKFSYFVPCLIDTGCLCYAAFSNKLVNENNLPRIKISQQFLQLAKNDDNKRTIDYVTYADFDFDGRRERIFGYIIKDLA